ncbi:MAG: hypothetical protein ACO1NU_04350 [Arcticibacter sp.]
MNSFKRNYLTDALQGFYDDFAEFSGSDGELTESEIGKLRAMYDAIMSNADVKFKDLEKVAGISLGSTENTSSASKTIGASMTEETASRALGIWTAMYDIEKRSSGYLVEQLATMNDGKSLLQQQRDIAMQGVVYQQRTAENTAATVQRLDSAITELKSINRNTGGVSSRDIGR